jgi:hypothetical protein
VIFWDVNMAELVVVRGILVILLLQVGVYQKINHLHFYYK